MCFCAFVLVGLAKGAMPGADNVDTGINIDIDTLSRHAEVTRKAALTLKNFTRETRRLAHIEVSDSTSSHAAAGQVHATVVVARCLWHRAGGSCECGAG